ncbi:MAG TPA: CRISPR-associated endonuclease Cas2 [Desulfobulbus sp.]|nr:CRISPR-associated endonuclease Cas2 [Desulfobulbus sp.]
MSRLWMVAYDISNDRVRREVRKALTNHGTKVQYSIFECFLPGRKKLDLQAELTALIEKGDSIRWYPLCAWCRDKIIRQGQGEETQNPEYFLL